MKGFIEKERTITSHDYTCQDKQQYGLNALTVGMCSKYLIKIARSYMENNSHKDITSRLIIKPIHQNYKRNDTHNEVNAIQRALMNDISMVISLDTC